MPCLCRAVSFTSAPSNGEGAGRSVPSIGTRTRNGSAKAIQIHADRGFLMEFALAVLFALTTCGLGFLLIMEKLQQREETKLQEDEDRERDLTFQVRRIEDKVDVSDPTPRSDIAVLGEAGSDYLNDEVARRGQQIAKGTHPESPVLLGRGSQRWWHYFSPALAALILTALACDITNLNPAESTVQQTDRSSDLDGKTLSEVDDSMSYLETELLVERLNLAEAMNEHMYPGCNGALEYGRWANELRERHSDYLNVELEEGETLVTVQWGREATDHEEQEERRRWNLVVLKEHGDFLRRLEECPEPMDVDTEDVADLVIEAK